MSRFFNPRFTLFALASAVRKAPKQLTSVFCPQRAEILVTGGPVSRQSFVPSQEFPTRCVVDEHLLHPYLLEELLPEKFTLPREQSEVFLEIKNFSKGGKNWWTDRIIPFVPVLEEETRGKEMSAVESALDVLSRAATMVQGQFVS